MKTKNVIQQVLLSAVVASSSVAVYHYQVSLHQNQSETKNQNQIDTPPNYVHLMQQKASKISGFEDVAEKVVHGVVHVKVEATYQQNYIDPFQEFFYGDGRRSAQRKALGFGSGVIISQDGYIVTNNHVIEGADKIEVVLNNKDTYLAKLIGTDPSTDIALLKVEAQNLHFLEFTNSEMVRLGEWVLAVGNPLNLTSTVTAGIVSAKGRNLSLLKPDPDKGIFPIESFIQTDAAVNQGNSGGALVNTQGDVVGIVTAIASTTGAYAGYSFAVPANIVKKVTADLLQYGKVQRAFLGVGVANITDEIQEKYKLKNKNGVFIDNLNEKGAAAEGGLKKEDIIKKIGDKDILDVADLQKEVGQYRPGDVIRMALERQGELLSKDITLKNLEGGTQLTNPEEDSSSVSALGAVLVLPNAKEKKALNLAHGVKVTEINPNGKMAQAGIRDGFIVVKVGNQLVKTPKEFLAVLKNAKGGVLLEGIYPNGVVKYYALGF
jgi:Do/DeqQ family serine protease